MVAMLMRRTTTSLTLDTLHSSAATREKHDKGWFWADYSKQLGSDAISFSHQMDHRHNILPPKRTPPPIGKKLNKAYRCSWRALDTAASHFGIGRNR